MAGWLKGREDENRRSASRRRWHTIVTILWIMRNGLRTHLATKNQEALLRDWDLIEPSKRRPEHDL